MRIEKDLKNLFKPCFALIKKCIINKTMQPQVKIKNSYGKSVGFHQNKSVKSKHYNQCWMTANFNNL